MNLSVSDISEGLGISDQAYRYWENGTHEPDIEHLVPLSELLECSTDYLICDLVQLEWKSIEHRFYQKMKDDLSVTPIPEYVEYLYLYFQLLVVMPIYRQDK